MLTKTDLETTVRKIIKPLAAEMKEFGRRQRKMERDLKLVVNYFDNEYLDHNKRITRIENHLGLQSN